METIIMTQAELKAKRSGQQPIAQAAGPLCLHRSARPIGKLKCSCANASAVYACREPWVTSGYCLPILPQQPGDGPILTAVGDKIVPADSRRPTFLPMPMLPGETPRPWDLVTCESCPQRQEPPPQIATLMRLGIEGDYDPETGHADVLHVLPASKLSDRIEVPDGLRLRSVTVEATANLDNAAPHVQATGCRLLIVYPGALGIRPIRATTEACPDVRIWWIDPDPKHIDETLTKVSYGLPADLAQQVSEATRRSYREAVGRVLAG